MENYYNLIEPLKKRVNEIDNSLYPQQLLSAGNEMMIFGTFEKTFEDYYKQSLRDGNRVNEIDYYNKSVKELEQIEESVLKFEKQIHLENNNSITFTAILGLIHKTKQAAKELIKNFDNNKTSSNKIVKSKNIKLKLTYKWDIDEDKLYEFKRLLLKRKLIDKSIDFQHFKYIFSNQPIIEIKHRIVWCNDNATQLIYLISELMEKGVIKKKTKNFDYVQLYQCFEKSTGEIFTENGKSLKNNIEIKINSDFKALTEQFIVKLLV